ncbi:MAG: 30S ribosomal protein S12 methylthiotransferase RimO [Eubacteriales bacterium]|nr:30S ribosomal protein S12 methylthiotransferase RimO [Eubacteriales bacterium]
MKAGIVSLGCAKNQVDTEEMLYFLKLDGIEQTEDFFDADILIVNTCGFIESAKEQSIETILNLAEYKITGKCELLCVTGCLSQRYATELSEEMPEIDLIIGVSQYDILPKLIKQFMQNKNKTVDTERRVQEKAQGRVLLTPPYSSYIRIAEGCNNRCSYCAIPLIRGNCVSRNEEDILSEMRSLAQKGVKEQILIAQDTTIYGRDLKNNASLAQLLDKAANIDGITWIRVLYCYPDETTKELIDIMAKHKNICKYLDLPLQHASPKMLKLMNRRGSIEHIKDILNYARDKGFTLRTTFIVGFPEETEEDFEQLLSFVKEMRFDRLGAFTYSREEDTPSYDMENQVPESIKQERLDKLMRLQQEISLENNLKRIGQTLKVLVVGKDGDYYTARSEFEAPDVDGIVYLKSSENLREGQFIKATIFKADTYDLYAESAGEA